MKARVGFIIFFLALGAGMASATETTRNWNFAVLLDGSRIGYHNFEVTDLDGLKEVRSEAKFDVKFLFFNAFRYRHENTERWSEDCLAEIDASTNSNGKRFEISGEGGDGGFLLESTDAQVELPSCVMTFAYWNPSFLTQQKLLNPQSGEYLDVEVEELPSESIAVRGEEVPARVFKVRAEKLELKLWYSDDDEWLGLESLAKGGRIIRYELS